MLRTAHSLHYHLSDISGTQPDAPFKKTVSDPFVRNFFLHRTGYFICHRHCCPFSAVLDVPGVQGLSDLAGTHLLSWISLCRRGASLIFFFQKAYMAENADYPRRDGRCRSTAASADPCLL